MKVGAPQAGRGQPVDMRRDILPAAVTAQIPVAEIVDENDHEIRPCFRGDVTRRRRGPGYARPAGKELCTRKYQGCSPSHRGRFTQVWHSDFATPGYRN